MTILVTAASKHGATAEIGTAIAAHLESLGISAEFRAPKDVFHLDEYDAVVVGSAVYLGNWLAEAREFVWSYAKELGSRPVWIFSSGPIGDLPKSEKSVDVHDILEVTGAREHRLFPGRLDRHLLGVGERAMVRAIGAREGDFRDWTSIAQWSGEIAQALRGVGTKV